MMNILMHLITGYNAVAYTHNYIFGFIAADMVYMVHGTADLMPYICKLDKASRGAGYALRFKPDRGQKAILMSQGATPILPDCIISAN